MRYTVFRGKSINTGEWVVGWYCRYPFGRLPLKDAIIPLLDAEDGHFEFAEVDPSTIGQFTGLCDNNGIFIYEGDIVDFYYGGEKQGRGQIVFGHGSFEIREDPNEDGCCMCYAYSEGMWFEVVGNIYD